jgi:mannose-6-phosphate isomerase-like protein (cupin superfamily)
MRETVVEPVPEQLEEGYAAPSCTPVGGSRSHLFAPAGYSLWQLRGELDAGTELRWSGAQGDEGIYVIDGELRVGDATAPAGGAVIVEAGVAATVLAPVPTRVVHFGPHDPRQPADGPYGPPSAEGHGVHVYQETDARLLHIEGASELRARSYADSKCPTCRITMFRTALDGPNVTESHYHSQDEIIYLLDGELQVGRTTVSAGMAFAVPKDVRYGFRSPGPYTFLNYRPDCSLMVTKPGTDPFWETPEYAMEQAERNGINASVEPGTGGTKIAAGV